MNEESYHMAKNFGEIQYNLILLDIQSLLPKDKLVKLQQYWNEFKAISNVSLEHADIMHSKYMPLLFAYQELFNIKGGCVPKLSLSQFTSLSHNSPDISLSHNSEKNKKIEGIDTNVDTTEIEKEIVAYLEDKIKAEKKAKRRG